MTIDLDMETRRALVDLLKPHIPEGEQKRVAYAVATALETTSSTGESKVSRLLNKHADEIERLLAPDRAEKVLSAICNELKLDMAKLVRDAQKAAKQRPRPSPDRHPAWQEFGATAPWVDKVPGLQDGTETLRQEISAHGQRVVWLVGPAGSGKSARLWRAQQAKIGRVVTDPIPDEAEPNAVWLIDEPANPDAWIAGAARCKARLVVATRVARQPREGESKLELSAWTRAEAETFLGQLGDARFDQPGDALAAVVATLATVDFEQVADKLAVGHDAVLHQKIGRFDVVDRIDSVDGTAQDAHYVLDSRGIGECARCQPNEHSLSGGNRARIDHRDLTAPHDLLSGCACVLPARQNLARGVNRDDRLIIAREPVVDLQIIGLRGHVDQRRVRLMAKHPQRVFRT